MEHQNTSKQTNEQSSFSQDQEGERKPMLPPQGLTVQTLKKQTLIAYQKVSEALKECTMLNRQIDETMEGVESSFQKLQRIDLELQGQLQIIRMLVVQLENKKLDVQLLFDKVLAASQCQQNLQTILAELSKSQVNQSIIKQSSSEESQNETKQSTTIPKQSDFESPVDSQNPPQQKSQQESQERKSEIQKTGSFPQDIQRIQTLCDFVDEDSISEISGKAELAFASLKSLKDKTLEVTENLIKKIETQISGIQKSKGDLDSQSQIIKDKYAKLKHLIGEVHKLFRSVEKIYVSIEQQGLNIQSQDHMIKFFQALVAIVNQTKLYMDEVHIVFDIFKTYNESYDDFYENSRESYVSFVNFAPSVQVQMSDVDKWHQQYDIRRLQCLEDFEEIEKLATWYEYFQKSYAEMEKEMIRRKNIDLEMQMKVEMMRQYLRIEIQEEQSKRLDFNDLHYRYLPPNLKLLLEDPPTRYEIYPKHYIDDEDSQANLNPQKIMEFLQDWSQKSKSNQLLSLSQQLGEDSEKLIQIQQDNQMLSGSVVQDDYFQKHHQRVQVEEENDNFVQLDNEDYEKCKTDKVESLKTNTSTKTSEEDKKTI